MNEYPDWKEILFSILCFTDLLYAPDEPPATIPSPSDLMGKIILKVFTILCQLLHLKKNQTLNSRICIMFQSEKKITYTVAWFFLNLHKKMLFHSFSWMYFSILIFCWYLTNQSLFYLNSKYILLYYEPPTQ